MNNTGDHWVFKFRLRRRNKTEMYDIGINSTCTVKELISEARTVSGLGKTRKIELMYGFPRRVLSNMDAMIMQSGVKNNELIELKIPEKKNVEVKEPKKRPMVKDSPAKRKMGSLSGKQVKKTKRVSWKKLGPGKSLNSEQQIGERLAEAVSSGSKDHVSKFLRFASKRAVENQYEVSKANIRYKASLSGNYRINEKTVVARRLGDGETMNMKWEVEYKFGRIKWEREEVTGLSKVLLKEIICQVMKGEEVGGENGSYVKESLRPAVMAQVSPAVFWSLVKAFGGGANIEAGLKELLPEANWDFLNKRDRRLSAKAKRAKETNDKLDAERRQRKQQRLDPDDLSLIIEDEKVLKYIVETLELNTQTALADADVAIFQDSDWAEQGETFIELARNSFLTRKMNSIVGDVTSIEKLKTLHVCFPYDIYKKKAPGRTEVLLEDWGQGAPMFDEVKKWIEAASKLLEEHSWIKYYVSREL